jgi:hypothetical protein
MTDRDQYAPGPARGAQVRKDGEKGTFILDGRAPADMFKRFAGVRSLYG